MRFTTFELVALGVLSSLPLSAQIATGSLPAPQAGVGAHDSSRDRLVALGPAANPGGMTWEFDGSGWIAVPSTHFRRS